MSVRIYGASDDLVELAGDIDDEIGCYNEVVILEFGSVKAGGVRIIADYAPDYASSNVGVWRMGIEPLDEDVSIPWEVRCDLGPRGYSCEVSIGCPKDTPFSFRKVDKS